MEIIYFDKAKEIWHRIAKSSDNQSLYFELEVHKRLLDFFHVGPHYYYIFNCFTAEMEFVDPKVIAVLGYTEQELTTQKIFESIHPEDVSYFLNFENEVTSFFSQLPVNKVLKYKVSYDYRVKKANGQYIRLLQQVTTIQSDEDGAVIRTLGVHTDISHLKPEGKPLLSFIGLDGEPSYLNVKPSTLFIAQKPLLSKREKEILKMIVEGKSSDMIAADLFISRHTVNTHRRNILVKTKSNGTADLVKKAIFEGFI